MPGRRSGGPNLWGGVPDVVEMQSEGGAAGAVHGALQAGALTTTFTASQGLLLMIPNLYKIAGELTAFCMHVAARTVATHALSIFGDHSDVMAARQTGFALLASSSVQEAHDLACIAQAATLAARVPFLHFFDGFRTSHEVAKIAALSDDDLRCDARRGAGRRPPRPRPDARSAGAARHGAEPRRVLPGARGLQPVLRRLPGHRAGHDGSLRRAHRPPLPPVRLRRPSAKPERVIVLMGSGAETARETVDWLVQRGERVGVLNVRLFRPFAVADFAAALPASVRAIAVLDRTKEPGAVGDPLYLDVVAALQRGAPARRGSGDRRRPLRPRRRRSSPRRWCARSSTSCAAAAPQNHFTVGIVDDCTHTSLPVDADFDIEPDDCVRAVFFGLGSDGTVGANKNSIKIIGEETDNWAQGYFVYDSKKAGAVTVSHLRFGPRPIRSAYLIRRAGFVACHQMEFLDRLDVLEPLQPDGVFLLNAPYAPGRGLGPPAARGAGGAAREAAALLRHRRLPRRPRSGPRRAHQHHHADLLLRHRRRAAARRGDRAHQGGDREELRQGRAGGGRAEPRRGRPRAGAPARGAAAGGGVGDARAAADRRRRGARLRAAGHRGDDGGQGRLPCRSARFRSTAPGRPPPRSGRSATWRSRSRSGTRRSASSATSARWSARTPPSAPRSYDPAQLAGAPEGFVSTPYRAPDLKGLAYTIQVAPEDCTGCHLCVVVCPAKDKTNPRHKAIDMQPQAPRRERERHNYRFFLDLPELDRTRAAAARRQGRAVPRAAVRVLRRLRRLRRDAVPQAADPALRRSAADRQRHRLLVDLRRQPADHAVHRRPRRPRAGVVELAVRGQRRVRPRLPPGHRRAPRPGRCACCRSWPSRARRRARRGAARRRRPRRGGHPRPARARRRCCASGSRASTSPRRAASSCWPTTWCARACGWWAATAGRTTSATAGSTTCWRSTATSTCWCSTPRSTPTPAASSRRRRRSAPRRSSPAPAKSTAKKDLGMEMMSYGHVYVARVAFGAKVNQVVHALAEADAYPGPVAGHRLQPLHRARLRPAPRRRAAEAGRRLRRLAALPLRPAPASPRASRRCSSTATRRRVPVKTYMQNEARFRMVERMDAARFKQLAAAAQREATQRFAAVSAARGCHACRRVETEANLEGAATVDAGDGGRQ